MEEDNRHLVLKWHAKDLKACKRCKHSMLRTKNMKASKEQYTRGMQYTVQMTKPTLDRAQSCQNNGLNMLKWELKMLEEHAHMLAYK